jgi:acetyl-CoA synthetase
MSDFVWEPSSSYVNEANVTRLMKAHGIDDYRDLVKRSQDDIEWFWGAAIDDLGIEFYEPYDKILDTTRGWKHARWFVGGSINLAHVCVDKHVIARPDARAIVWEGEDGVTKTLTFSDLQAEVNRVANGLVERGIGKGDCVGVFLPMTPEAAIAAYACAKIGAIYLPIFSGFGAPAVATRLQDADVKALFTADGFFRRGLTVDMKETADAAVARCEGVEHVFVLGRLGNQIEMGPKDEMWDEAFGSQSPEFESVRLDPEAPVMIAYTSGTTGKPKGAVHVHGGLVVKMAEEAAYQTDIHPDDLLFWVTDMGWIMGPWEMIGANSLGAAFFMYEGAPNHPKADRLWAMIERHSVTALGVSPTLIRALISAGDEMVTRHDLSSLRVMGSTGEPWNPEPYRWLSSTVGKDEVPIINISGGTEIGACFLGQAPVIPTKSCSLGYPALGMAVDVYDSEGKPVRGEVGELVCTKPWPAMTRSFWNDDERFIESYWSRFDDVWVHGDWASIDEDGYWYLHGRSDDTMNVAGKRIGPAEFESAAVQHPDVVECAAVGVPDEIKGTAVWCFCILKPGVEGDGELTKSVEKAITSELGKAFRPAEIRFVTELPKTRSAKILRRAIRARVMGEDPGDMSSLENPSALEEIEKSIT